MSVLNGIRKRLEYASGILVRTNLTGVGRKRGPLTGGWKFHSGTGRTRNRSSPERKALFTLADPGAGSAALRRHGNAVGSAVAFTLTGSWPVGS